jgi:hypothetical protein
MRSPSDRQRLNRSVAQTNASASKIRFVELDAEHEVVSERGRAASVTHDHTAQGHDLEADSFKGPAKQPVPFVTPAASLGRGPATTRLAKADSGRECDAPAELDIGILLHNVLEMPALQTLQRGEV